MPRESRRQLVPLLLQEVLVQSSETKPIPEFTKLKTAKLADKMGIMVTALYDRLLGRGYLED
jgi:hypothetical protein